MNTRSLEQRSDLDTPGSNWELHPSLGEGVTLPVSAASDEASNLAIEAYRKGKEIGHTEGKQEGRRQITALLDEIGEIHEKASADLARRVLACLAERSYKFGETHLRVIGLLVYNILIEVEESAFVSDDFLQVYDVVWQIEHEARCDTFFPTINFISVNFNETNPINYQALIGDGYIYRLQGTSTA